MKIVDTHCHAGINWFEPVEVLLHQMNANDVEQAVLIQHRGAFDNDYLFECGERYPGRFAIVAMVDHAAPDATATLERLAERGAAGVRLGPAVRSPGDDPLAIWHKAHELGLIVSSLGSADEFGSDEFASLIAELEGLTVIIEHLAGAGLAAARVGPPSAAFLRALQLSRHPNVYIKVGGLGEISLRPPVLRARFAFHETPPLIELAMKAFGRHRMMWGSDFPPVAGREGYRNALQGVMEHPALADEADRAWVMGQTAERLFALA